MTAFKLSIGSKSNSAAAKMIMPPSVRISKITTYGEVTLEFSNPMVVTTLSMI